MRAKIAMGLCLFLAIGGIPGIADDIAVPSGQTTTIDPATLDKMVQQEVQRQLPAQVQAEVRRQIEALAQEAARDGAANSAFSTIQATSSQLELYKIQHYDRYPPMTELADWKALLQPTDSNGNYSGPRANLGPYIPSPPANPFTGKTHIAAAGSATLNDGWNWDQEKEVFRLVFPKKAAAELVARYGARVAPKIEAVNDAAAAGEKK